MLFALFDYRIQLKTADWAPGKDTCVSQWIHPSHHDDQFIHIPHRKRLQIYAVAKSCSCAWPPPSLYRPFHFLFYFLYLTSSFAVGIITTVNRGHRWERNVDVSCDVSFFHSPTWSFFSDEDRLKKTTAAKCSFGQQVSEFIVLFYLSVGQHFQTNNQYPSPSHGSWTSPLLKGKEARHSASSKHKEIKKKRVKEGKYSQCFVIMWFEVFWGSAFFEG